jgi:hypothetical protein
MPKHSLFPWYYECPLPCVVKETSGNLCVEDTRGERSSYTYILNPGYLDILKWER